MVKNRCIKTNKHESGFTLVEMMTTLVIGGLLMSFAVPGFNGMLKNNRVSAHTNEFITAMNLARSEAIKRRARINVTATTPSDTTNEWGGGWNVQVNGGETVRVYPSTSSGIKFDSTASRIAFQYLPSGRINSTDTLTLCDDRTGETGRQITIAATGRITSSNITCT